MALHGLLPDSGLRILLFLAFALVEYVVLLHGVPAVRGHLSAWLSRRPLALPAEVAVALTRERNLRLAAEYERDRALAQGQVYDQALLQLTDYAERLTLEVAQQRDRTERAEEMLAELKPPKGKA